MLVDTSVWIDYFNGHSSPEADRLARAIADHEPILLCGIVLTEIHWAPEPEITDYREAATLYRRCRAKGYTICSTIDCLIAQLYIRHHHNLLTKDHDFRLIASCHPLQLVT